MSTDGQRTRPLPSAPTVGYVLARVLELPLDPETRWIIDCYVRGFLDVGLMDRAMKRYGELRASVGTDSPDGAEQLPALAMRLIWWKMDGQNDRARSTLAEMLWVMKSAEVGEAVADLPELKRSA